MRIDDINDLNESNYHLIKEIHFDQTFKKNKKRKTLKKSRKGKKKTYKRRY